MIGKFWKIMHQVISLLKETFLSFFEEKENKDFTLEFWAFPLTNMLMQGYKKTL